MKQTMLVLTKSIKNGNYCVAGITDKKKWIRLVTDDADSDGAIPGDYMVDDNRGEPIKPLDLISVEVEECFDSVQPENCLVNLDKKPQVVCSFSLADLAPLMKNFESGQSTIFGNTGFYLSPEQLSVAGGSLAWCCVKDLKIYLQSSPAGVRTRADFIYNGHQYQNMRVTDSDYFKISNSVIYKDAYLVISIPHKPWTFSDGVQQYYKMVAKIFGIVN